MNLSHDIKYVIAGLSVTGIILNSDAANTNSLVSDIQPYTVSNLNSPKEFQYFDGNTYTQLSNDGRCIEKFDIKTGKKIETILDLSSARETVLKNIEGYRFSPDKKKILVWNDTKSIYRRSTSARYFVYEIRSKLLRPLSPEMEQTQSPIFSNDGRMVAFVFDNNIFIKKIDFNSVVQVTKDGEAGKIINGAVDWTYEEEFTMTSSMVFAPDNSTLCFVKTNETAVPSYSLTLYKGTCDPMPEYALYPGRFTYKYPVAGEQNSKVSVHTYEIDTRKTKDISIPDTRVEYIPRITFGDTGDRLLVSTLNRDQNHFEIYSINPKTGVSKSVYSEDSKAWITPETYEKLKTENDGFVVLSSKTGWARLYKYSYTGSLLKTLTPDGSDALDYYGTDINGSSYYQAASSSPIDRTVYKVDSKGIVTPISPINGSSRATFAPGCTYAMLVSSDINTPPNYSIIDAKGQKIRVIEKNEQALAKKTDGTIKEFLKVPGANGDELNAYIIKPRDFNPEKTYPVVMYQYSGPGSQTVINEWHHDWQNYFASKGYIIFCVDGRGTGGRGTSFMYPVYRNLGKLETEDQVAAARWLSRQSWVDATRIGMHGWSYGGYETLMCLSSIDNPFKAGVAVAPVTDWRFYDTVYAERYMLTPQQNDEGYNSSAPLKKASQMNKELLIMSGTADDNVHPENTLEYASALQSAGCLFNMMMFPNKNHSINGCNARAVVYANMFKFFKNNL